MTLKPARTPDAEWFEPVQRWIEQYGPVLIEMSGAYLAGSKWHSLCKDLESIHALLRDLHPATRLIAFARYQTLARGTISKSFITLALEAADKFFQEQRNWLTVPDIMLIECRGDGDFVDCETFMCDSLNDLKENLDADIG